MCQALLVIALLLIDRMSRGVQIFHEWLEYKVKTEYPPCIWFRFRDVDLFITTSDLGSERCLRTQALLDCRVRRSTSQLQLLVPITMKGCLGPAPASGSGTARKVEEDHGLDLPWLSGRQGPFFGRLSTVDNREIIFVFQFPTSVTCTLI